VVVVKGVLVWVSGSGADRLFVLFIILFIIFCAAEKNAKKRIQI
jgi:hypothetical protein